MRPTFSRLGWMKGRKMAPGRGLRRGGGFEALERRNLLSGDPPVASDDAYRVDEHQALVVDAVGPTTTGLVHHWTFDETSGNVAADSAGDNDGLMSNWSATQSKWVTGKLGGALAFDGFDDQVVTSQPINLNHYTISFWLLRDAPIGTFPRVISPRDQHWILENRNPGRGVGFFYVTGSQEVQAPTPQPNGVWVHYAFVFNRLNATATMYRDGVLLTSGGVSRAAPLLTWVMGHNEDLAHHGETWKGALDDVRIYNRLLSATEVAGLRSINGVRRNDVDPEGDVTTVQLVSPPTHGSLTLGAAGGFTYQPAADYNGTDQFTYRLSDGTGLSNVATVQLSGLTFDDPPVTASDTYTVNEDAMLNVSAPGVLANDVEDEGQPMSVALAVGPQHGTLTLSANGAFEYHPAVDFFGTDTFTYVASDGTLAAAPTTVTIQVVDVPDPPLARNDQFVVNEDATLVVDASPRLSVRSVAIPSAKSLTWDRQRNLVYVTDGAGHRVVPVDPYTGVAGTPIALPAAPGDSAITDDGRYLYVGMRSLLSVGKIDLESRTLVAQYFIGYDAEDIETLPGQPDAMVVDRARVGVSPRAALAVIYDNGVARPQFGSGGNRLVVSTDGTEMFGLDIETSEKTVVRNRIDAQGFQWIAQRSLAPFGGGDIVYRNSRLYLENGLVLDAQTLTPLANSNVGVFPVLIPNSNRIAYIRQAADTLRIVDGTTLAVLDTVSVPGSPMVTLIPGVAFGDDGVVLAANNGIVYFVQSDRISGWTQRGVLANDLDVDNGPLTVVPIDPPQHGNLTLNPDGTFQYQPAPNFSGVDQFTYRVSDGLHLSNVATVTITVESTNDPPTANGDAYLVPLVGDLVVAAASGVLANDIDPESNPLTATLVSPPAHGTVVLSANGSFRYTPAAGYLGPDSFTYRARDAELDSTPATVSLTVDAPTIVVGQHSLAANRANQQITLFVSGGHDVSGLNFFAQVGDGGPELSGLGLPAGTDGPAITAIDIKSGGIFAAVPDNPIYPPGIPQVQTATLALSTPGESVAAEGVLATISVDTTGFFSGTWALKLTDVLPFPAVGGPFRTDFAGLPVNITNGTLTIVPTTVVARHVFYNHSSFDENDPAANEADDDAIATNKSPLRPGQTASFANYTSYSRGINGVLLDVANPAGDITAADFTFRVGNSSNTATWAAAPPPQPVVVRPGAGAAGSDRIMLTWADGEIVNSWLQVTLRSTTNTGLAQDDVFYFGNSPGESGDSPTHTLVNATDVIGARDNKRGPLNQATVADPYDFNRDRLVNATDVVFARDHTTSPFTSLQLIAPPGSPSAPSEAPQANGAQADGALSEVLPSSRPTTPLPAARRVVRLNSIPTGRGERRDASATAVERSEVAPLRAGRQRSSQRVAEEVVWATFDSTE